MHLLWHAACCDLHCPLRFCDCLARLGPRLAGGTITHAPHHATPHNLPVTTPLTPPPPFLPHPQASCCLAPSSLPSRPPRSSSSSQRRSLRRTAPLLRTATPGARAGARARPGRTKGGLASLARVAKGSHEEAVAALAVAALALALAPTAAAAGASLVRRARRSRSRCRATLPLPLRCMRCQGLASQGPQLLLQQLPSWLLSMQLAPPPLAHGRSTSRCRCR